MLRFRTTACAHLLLLITACVALLVAPVPVKAATVTGTLKDSWAGAAAPAGGSPTPGASATWSFNFSLPHPGDGNLPATLTAAAQSFVTPCDPNFDQGSETSSITAISDPVAAVNLTTFLDLRRHRGHIAFRAAHYYEGTVTRTTSRQCTPPLNDMNGVSSSEVPLYSLFGGSGAATPKDWPIRQGSDHAWTGAGSQTISAGDTPTATAPEVEQLSIRLTGAPARLSAQCRMPTPRELRRFRTVRAAKAYLATTGFTHPLYFVLPSGTVRKGHFFVHEQDALNTYRQCGDRLVTLARSRGRR